MEPVSGEEFLEHAAGLGVAFDTRYPGARCLGFVPPRGDSRFWVLPGDPAAWPHFAASVLGGLDHWSSGWLWPRCGQWPAAESSSSRNERVRDTLLRGAGVPGGWSGAVRFERGEEDAIVAILFVYLAFGWYTYDDLYFLPQHGRQIVMTDHHDVLHVKFADETRVPTFIRHMSEAGYELPTAPPDPTFKWPAWMGKRPV